MKKKNKYLIENIEYSDNEIAKKILNKNRISDIIFYLTYLLLTLLYCSFIFIRISTVALLFISIIYVIFALELSFLQKAYSQRLMRETINITVCPEAFFNINLYNAKKIICKEKAYNYFVSNIAKAYILLGKTEKAQKIIKNLDKNKKNIKLQGEILQNKIDIAFIKRDLKEFNKQYENLNKISKFLPKRFKKENGLSNKIKRSVLEKDIKEVDNLCELVNKKKDKYTKIMSAYYKGTVLEESGNDNYNDYYKFVADNGNNLMIANQVRKKLKINDIKHVYKNKKHIIYNTFKIITFIILLFINFVWLTNLFAHLK